MSNQPDRDPPIGVAQKRDMTPLPADEAARTRKMMIDQVANNPSPIYRKIFENALAKDGPLTADLLSLVSPFVIETADDLLFELPERIATETKLFGSIDVRTDGIVIFTGEEWSNLETRVERLPYRNPEARLFKRLILGWACEIWVEDGHVRIPVPLYEEARISRGSQITDHKTYCILQEPGAAPESGPNER